MNLHESENGWSIRLISTDQVGTPCMNSPWGVIHLMEGYGTTLELCSCVIKQ